MDGYFFFSLLKEKDWIQFLAGRSDQQGSLKPAAISLALISFPAGNIHDLRKSKDGDRSRPAARRPHKSAGRRLLAFVRKGLRIPASQVAESTASILRDSPV
jgi:hypothetical protein